MTDIIDRLKNAAIWRPVDSLDILEDAKIEILRLRAINKELRDHIQHCHGADYMESNGA